ncbi:hypothetical protein Poly30_16630 [Planctomycetes bacterium Poly30]|uniref:Uncharacterized protein n=2 Tax=Saltatorellus ferox TaxID=2528018 RepID=A0A518EQ10_9BACT|nr:hypothetical protein Poly30_16630 [Planctomycetes bacterium Poly30]
MSHSWKANRGPDRHRGEVYEPEDGHFELHADDVWDDDAMGRFARERWSAAPRKRRSKWLGTRLEDLRAELDDEDLEAFDIGLGA